MTNDHNILTADDITLSALMLPYFDDIDDDHIDDYISIALRDDDDRTLHAILAESLALDIADLLANANIDDLLPCLASLHLADDDIDALSDRIRRDFDTDHLAHLILTRLP